MHIVNNKPGQERRERLEYLALLFVFIALCAIGVIRAPYAASLIITAAIITCAMLTFGYGVANRAYDISTEGIIVIWYGRFSRRYRWDAFSEIGTFLVTGTYGKRENWLICSEIPIKKNEAGYVSSNWACTHPMKVLCFTALTAEQERCFYKFLTRL